MSEFRQLGLSDWLVKRLASLSIKKPSAIQKAVIPVLLKERRNIFGCSQTGTGKTLAYVLPILERLVVDPRPYFALILAPTRELAHQIHDVITVLAGPKSKTANALVTSLLIIGGGNYGVENASEDVQGLWLGKPNIIVATPGRFLDQIINRNYLDVCGSKRSFKFEILVMDEGDQLITPGFCNQLKDLLNWIDCKEVGNKRRQTVVLSASLTPALEALKQVLSEKDESNQPIVIDLLPTIDSIKKELSTNPYLDQRYFLCPSNVKAAFLVEALLDLDFKQLIIFCGTKREAKLIHKILITLGFAGKDFNLNPVLLNSDLKQALRFAAIDKFKSLKSRILVTTDLASRGLDLPLVDLIINYNCPKSAISYVHRVGRTCRKPHLNSSISLPVPELMEETLPTQTTEETSSTSESNLDPKKFLTPRSTKAQHKYLGKAITLVSQYDIKLLKNIESFIGIRMEQEEAIDEEHCNEILKQVTYAVKDAEIAIEKEMNELAEVKGVDLESKQKKRKSEMTKQIGKLKK